MPYFVDRVSRTVIEKDSGTSPLPRESVVDGETAAACSLTPGQVLTDQQIIYLLDGSILAFNVSVADSIAAAASLGKPSETWGAPALVIRLRKDGSSFVVSFGGSSVDMHLAPPLTILREADFDNGQRVVALSGTWNSVPNQLIVLSGDTVVLSPFDDVPRAAGDHRATSERVEQSIVAFGNEYGTSFVPVRVTANGTISTDGAFVTLTMGAQRKHFVVAMDDLPLLRSPLTVLSDGSLHVDLVLPGDGPLLLKVPSDSAIEAEKAIALITSIQRSKGGSIGGELGAHQVLAREPQRELDYQMSGWSEQDLSAALEKMKERGIVGRLAGKFLTVPFSDQIAADDVIKLMRVSNSPSPTRSPGKFLNGEPYAATQAATYSPRATYSASYGSNDVKPATSLAATISARPKVWAAVVAVAVVVAATFAVISANEDSAALLWLKAQYGTSGPDVELGCSQPNRIAAGLDWYPGIGFSLADLEAAWSDLCS